MSNVIGSSRESNPTRRICHLHAVPLGHVADLVVKVFRVNIVVKVYRANSALDFQIILFQVCSYHSAMKSQESRSYSPNRGSPIDSPMKEDPLLANDEDGLMDMTTQPPIDSLDSTEVEEQAVQRRSYLR